MKRKYVYLVLGIVGIFNTTTSFMTSLLSALIGVIGLSIGNILSALAIPFLLIGWYYHRVEKYAPPAIEPSISKYGFWLSVSLLVFVFLYAFLFGIYSVLSATF